MDEAVKSELQKAFLDSMRRIRHGERGEVYQNFSRGEFFALAALHRLRSLAGEDGGVRVSELIADLQLSPQATSKTLRILEGKGYVVRETDKKDRRNTLVYLTAEAETLLAHAKDAMDEFCTMVIDRMGEDEMREFIRLTEKCTTIMQEVGTELYQTKKGGEAS